MVRNPTPENYEAPPQNTNYNDFSAMSSPSFTGEEQEVQSYPTLGIIRELNPFKDIQQFQNYLRGKMFNPETGKYEQIFAPRMNEEGINHIMSIITTVVNQNMRTTYLEADEISRMMDYFCIEYIPEFFIDYQKYGITELNSLSSIIGGVNLQAYAILKKAYRGGDRTLIRQTTNESIHSSTDIGQKRGFLARMLGK